jgi:transcriptional regulator with XRE-family HTH domain
MANKQYDNVSDLIGDLIEDGALANQIRQEIGEQRLSTALFTMRTHQGMTQTDVAEKIGCSQSAVSKLEHATEDQITVGDLVRYSSALGLNLSIRFTKNMTAVESVKHHFFQIKEHLDRLRDLAGDDGDMKRGVDRFYNEFLANVLRLYQAGKSELSRKRIKQEHRRPVLQLSTPEDLPDDKALDDLVKSAR